MRSAKRTYLPFDRSARHEKRDKLQVPVTFNIAEFLTVNYGNESQRITGAKGQATVSCALVRARDTSSAALAGISSDENSCGTASARRRCPRNFRGGHYHRAHSRPGKDSERSVQYSYNFGARLTSSAPLAGARARDEPPHLSLNEHVVVAHLGGSSNL